MQRALSITLSSAMLSLMLSGCLFGESSAPPTKPGYDNSGRDMAQEVVRNTKQNMYPPGKITDRLPQSRQSRPTQITQDRLPRAEAPGTPPDNSSRLQGNNRIRLAVRHPAPTERLPQESERIEHDRSGLALGQFYMALQEVEAGRRRTPVTILHLGDSHIAADRFSGDLRAYFQSRFGNAGRGLVMPGSPFGYSHSRGLKISNQGNWTISNSQRGHAGQYGITGINMTSNDPEASLTLTTTGKSFDYAEATLLSGPNMGSARIQTDRENRTVNLASSRIGLKHVRLKKRSRTLRVRPSGEDPITLLSWSVGKNRPGIRYINLGIPGASVQTTRKWNTKLFSEEVRRLKPDLIVLAYGTNEGFNDKLNLDAYQRYYRRFVQRLRSAAPQASVLIIGPPDGARLPRYADKEGAGCKALSRREISTYTADLKAQAQHLARWHAPPKLAQVRAALKRIAGRIQARFWDWSKVMGRNCGIHKWAGTSPRKAVSDHVHLTSRGAKASAKNLFDDLMNQYVSHKRMVRRSR